MKHLLGRESVALVEQVAWSRVLLAFDFDGTLAPIVAERDAAVMRERTQQLFRRVCTLYPCAVVSGRARSDVRHRLGGAKVRYIVGNHGLEPGESLGAFRRQISAARPVLRDLLGGVPGVDIEDKEFSLAVHYRRSRRKRIARAAILAAVESLPGAFRMVAGKCVLNVLPARAPHKGDAVLKLRAAAGADTALYVGDDVTDEDVFQIDQPGRLLNVRVNRSPSSAAAYYLRDQREVDALLARLCALREKRAA